VKNGESIFKAQAITQEYLRHTEAKFTFYDRVTQEMFGRDIAHIWILHINTINAKLLDKLLDVAKQYGYTFITLDEALQDNAYVSLDNYFDSFGPSWLYRWDYSDKKKIDWSGEPDPKI
jgi:spore germination protein YaaH